MSDRAGIGDVRTNLTHWDAVSDEYQLEHAAQLNTKQLAWGVFALPEDELRVLGDVEGKAVLELGCGAAQWSIFLAGRGARPIGFDLSANQLGHARLLMAEFGTSIRLVQGSATELPFSAAAFDVVFCDHGAMSFADPYDTVPEVARVLRPGGLFAFSMTTPLVEMCVNPQTDEVDAWLHVEYFEMHRIEGQGWGPGPHVMFQLPYGEWIRLFRRNGLIVEDLIETHANDETTSTYWNQRDIEWSKRWPSEHIWKLRKEPSG
jgi:SAM-dependent methyltransferase